MKKRYGFFLMDTMVSFFCLTFAIVFFGKCFVSIVAQELKVRDQLQLLSVIQYNMEKMWLKDVTIDYDIKKYDYELIPLPLPTENIPLSNRVVKYSYNMLCIKMIRDKTVFVALPGYIYAEA